MTFPVISSTYSTQTALLWLRNTAIQLQILHWYVGLNCFHFLLKFLVPDDKELLFFLTVLHLELPVFIEIVVGSLHSFLFHSYIVLNCSHFLLKLLVPDAKNVLVLLTILHL